MSQRRAGAPKIAWPAVTTSEPVTSNNVPRRAPRAAAAGMRAGEMARWTRDSDDRADGARSAAMI